MILSLGISHVDAAQAVHWLKHIAFLASKEIGDHPVLVIAGTRRVNANQWAQIRQACRKQFRIEHTILADEEETGYPKSASHLFLRTMEHCERGYPDQPVLWLESDTLPMRPGWHWEIAAEYRKCGQPFMGHIEGGHGPAHLAGVAVYPHDWRARAPLLASVLSAPDVFWGRGMGQAFDTYASPETLPQAAMAETIRQVWRPTLPITEGWLAQFAGPKVALFHQIKDQSGFRLVKARVEKR